MSAYIVPRSFYTITPPHAPFRGLSCRRFPTNPPHVSGDSDPRCRVDWYPGGRKRLTRQTQNYQAVFKRYEKKYLLNRRQYEDLSALLAEHMHEDQFGLHTVSSVYLDTDSYEIIRESLAKPAYKEKLRLRSYGTPGPHDTVYLELKKKVDGIVYKRRTDMSLREAERYLRAGIRPARGSSQILSEIDWFMGRRPLRPRVVISCDRLALAGDEDPNFRVTFDFNMRWRADHLSLADGSGGAPLISPEYCLMEVKTAGALPLWLSRFLSEEKIFPTSFSKYGTCYRDHLLKGDEVSCRTKEDLPYAG
ncbi:MAG: polyphosphate polymerase domain-containing protein [Clostridia bacterium]|nr:polyphosphate polymerase domain-containing protein [Clostridia bacterium]